MRAFFLIGFYLLVLAPATIAQDFHYSIRNYKAIDGLPQSQVNVMLEDGNGYLWIGTYGGGLARFDGREFKVYTTLDGLLSNIVTSLKFDKNQNLWIVHPRGITKFDGVSFKKFQQPGNPSGIKRIKGLFEFQDTLFFISAPGQLGKIYKDSVYYWTKKTNVSVWYNHLNPNKEITLYFSDSSFLVRSSAGDYSLEHKKKFNRLFSMFNYKNEVWVYTDSGYFSIDFKNRDFTRQDLCIRNRIIFYDSLNEVFWTRDGNNLFKEKLIGKSSAIETVLKDVEITQVLMDSEGSTWFATSGSGLYKYFIQDFDRCGSENLRGVMAIFIDRYDDSWIGSMTKGLWKIKQGKVTSYLDKKEPYRNAVYCIKESPEGILWVGTGYGLGRYNREEDKFSWYTREDGLSHMAIMSLQFDEHNGLWIGTYGGGVNYFDGKSFKSYTVKEGLASNAVMSSYYSKEDKTLFLGSEFGVNTIENNKVSYISIPGIENTTVISMQAYQDSLLLLGTGGAGVVIYNPKTKGQRFITTHDGLPSDFIYFAAADDQNYTWIGTEKGISRIRLDKKLEVIDNLHYDYDNGLTGVETNQNAFYLSKEDKFFGLIDGLYQFNDLKREERKSFDLHLSDVEIAYGQFSARDYADSVYGFFKIPFHPVLPPDKNHITFHFNRVDKRYPKSVKFKYQLENFDKTWSQPSSADQVTYSNLPSGDYVFRVMATDNQGIWSVRQIAYPFTVQTPFYQTASFIVGVFILVAGILTLILYVRVKQRVNKVIETERIRIREQESLRKEIARDFHDEMGNQLTRIINYVSLLKLNGSSGFNHTELYGKVESSAKYLYSGTRDFIWAIDPVNDELSKLFIYIRDFGEKLFEEKGIQFRAFNEVKEKMKLPYGFSREANLIFKEAMTNAFKYSMAKNVKLLLMQADDGFEMIFEDDGIGFYPGEVEELNGLKNIRERADRVNAILRIQSGKTLGTKIILNFKLTKTLKYGLTL